LIVATPRDGSYVFKALKICCHLTSNLCTNMGVNGFIAWRKNKAFGLLPLSLFLGRMGCFHEELPFLFCVVLSLGWAYVGPR